MERGRNPGNHSRSRKGISKSKLGIVCWKCDKKGHLKKYCKSWKGKEGDVQQENNHEVNVIGDVLQDALILSLQNIINTWVVDSGTHSMPHLIGSIFMIMFKEILDKFDWLIINPIKSLEWVQFS